jgi:hypothetical protein
LLKPVTISVTAPPPPPPQPQKTEIDTSFRKIEEDNERMNEKKMAVFIIKNANTLKTLLIFLKT